MSKTIYPQMFQWDGEAMYPLNPHAADRQYVVGETYRLIPHEDRSPNSHNHYFAALHEAWNNLPENLAERFPTVDHLRKYALIKAGYRDERSIVCASMAEAERVAAFIAPMDTFALVAVSHAVVTVYTAKSQSKKAMGKMDFQKSKQAVLDIVSDMIGVAREELQRHAARNPLADEFTDRKGAA